MSKQHTYHTTLNWTGNTGEGTQSYRSYERSYEISINGKANIQGSSDPAFLGNATKHNPEELLLASLSGCHMLWYLHLCAEAGIKVIAYTDEATATMTENTNGSGRFTEAVLHPKVVVSHASMINLANTLHHKANEFCFIANSVNFPVRHESVCVAG